MKMCLLMMWLLIGEARWIVKCTGLKTLLRQILQNWWDCTSLCKSIMTQSIQQKTSVECLDAKKSRLFQRQSQLPDFSPAERAFQLLNTKLNTERLTNMQWLNASAAKAQQSSFREETQNMVMSMDSRCQSLAATDSNPINNPYI